MRCSVKRSLLALSIAGALTATGSAHATNGYQLIGVGAYQKSLAGATTANPGSAMTAITNPAGFAMIEDRADFSMEAFNPERETDFTDAALFPGLEPGDDVDSDSTLYGVPALGWKAPVGSGGNMWFGGGIFGTSGLGVDYEQTVAGTVAGNPAVLWDGYSAIAFWQAAPTLAWSQSDTLHWGVSLNLDYQAVEFRQRFQDPAGNTLVNFDLGRTAQEFGFGASAGVMWEATSTVTLGAYYKSKQYFQDLEYNLAAGDIDFTGFGGGPLEAGTYELELDYPQQAAIGVAWDAMPTLTLSADVKWIDWSDTLSELDIDGPGSNDVTLDTDWEDSWIYAIGVAWAVTPKVNLRAGFNYAEAPIDDDDVDNNLLLPAIVEQHYTVGGDVDLGQGWDLGFHFMYVPEETLESPDTGTEISMYQYSAGFNIGYAF